MVDPGKHCQVAHEARHLTSLGSSPNPIDTHCEGVGGVQGALTLFCGGVAQAFHDNRVVELKEQLVVEEVDGEGQEGKVKEEGRGRIKENECTMDMTVDDKVFAQNLSQ